MESQHSIVKGVLNISQKTLVLVPALLSVSGINLLKASVLKFYVYKLLNS